MIVTALPDGDLIVPVRIEGEDGTIGDGTERIGPDHPDYMRWQDAIDSGQVDLASPEMSRTAVEEHGELGPVLTERAHEFQSEAEAKKRE